MAEPRTKDMTHQTSFCPVVDQTTFFLARQLQRSKGGGSTDVVHTRISHPKGAEPIKTS